MRRLRSSLRARAERHAGVLATLVTVAAMILGLILLGEPSG
jgi:hypothetical protein